MVSGLGWSLSGAFCICMRRMTWLNERKFEVQVDRSRTVEESTRGDAVSIFVRHSRRRVYTNCISCASFHAEYTVPA